MNGSTGEIDVSSSTIGIYTITYETSGICSVQNNEIVEIESCFLVPDTKVINSDCGITLGSITERIYCDAVLGATDYKWEVSKVGGGYYQEYERGNYLRYIAFSYPVFSGVSAGAEYDVRVKAKVGNVWGDYNTVCQLTTPSSSAINPNDDVVSKSFNIGVSSTNIVKEVNVYPNPAKDKFTVELNDVTLDGKIQLMNSVGQLVYQENINSNRTEIKVYDLPRGIYFLRISHISGDVISKKVMIE